MRPRVTEAVHPRDPQAELAALRASGADRIDPLRFHFLQTLAARELQSEGELRRDLAARFDRALQTFVDRVDMAAPAEATPPTVTPLVALGELRRLLDANADASGAPTELKSVRYFGETWAQLSIERQIGEALRREPEHAGPLNSHLLVLRALAAMRELSPAYLKHFMTYIDALLLLDHAAAARIPSRPAPAKTRKRAASPKPPMT